MRHLRLATLAVAILLGLSACSSTTTPAPTPGPSAAPAAASGATGHDVSITNFSFQPAAITVSAGTTVTWTNHDTAGHTVTADDGSFKSDTLASGATFSHTFATAGSFAYHCSIHSSMKGTVAVQ